MGIAFVSHLDGFRGWFERRGAEDLEKLFLVILTCAVLMWGVRFISKAMRKAIRSEHLNADTERRAKTLGSVLQNTARILILAFFILATLQLFGVNTSPLVAGAGIAGAAVAFGAQSLVKDVIAGFFLLMENQYAVGDIISLGDKTGTVERMTLRITLIRDGEGKAHYVPNGSISQVTVLSKDFSRALVDLDLRGDQDLDRVTAILLEMGQELQRDLPDVVLEPTEVKGLESIAGDSFRIRTLTTTAPGKQWEIARELRRRVLFRFRMESIFLATLPKNT